MGSGRKIQRSSKYLGASEDEFEPGSRGQVLRNKLGIYSKRKMDDLEIIKYRDATLKLTDYYPKDYSFNENDIKVIHREIFKELYDWAGQYRRVDISKEYIRFAKWIYIDKLMKEYSETYLEKLTPPENTEKEKLSYDLAVLHNEFIIIHPFREGNGRTIRLLLYLIALQADYKGLDFGMIDEKGKSYERYIEAIQQGLDGNHTLMAEIIQEASL
jgi:cell filamentation protein